MKDIRVSRKKYGAEYYLYHLWFKFPKSRKIGRLRIADNYLTGFSVDYEYRNRGYGLYLLKYAIRKHKEDGNPLLFLHCYEERIAFYKRAGFEIDHTIPNVHMMIITFYDK